MLNGKHSSYAFEAPSLWGRSFRIWWILYGLGLLAMVFATPPFQVPDEPNHFFRVYQVVEGRAIALPSRRGSGDLLPLFLNDMRVILARGIPFNPQAKFTLRRWLNGWHIRADEQQRGFLEFANTSVYSPFVYLFQVAGLWMARVFELRPIIWIYAARAAGAIGVWLLASWCMHLAPSRWRPVFLLLLSAPMFMFQAAGVSADGLTNIMAFLFMAALLNELDPKNLASARRLLLLTGLAAALALCKLPYVMLVLLILLIPAARFPAVRERVAWVLGTLVFAFSISAAWNLAAKVNLVFSSPFREVTDPAQQIAFIRENPAAFAQVLGRTLKAERWHWLQQWVGTLGWLDVQLPVRVIWLYYIVFCFLTVSCTSPFAQRSWMAIVVLAIPIMGSLFLLTAIYMTFTPVRHPSVIGFQGRYAIPWGPLVAMTLAAIPWRPVKNASDRLRYVVAWSVGALCFLVALYQIIRRYYIA